jgi:hypothetical protein
MRTHDDYRPLPLACPFNSCKFFGEEDVKHLGLSIDAFYDLIHELLPV